MRKNNLSSLIAIATFIGVIVVNAMANILPINGISTGDVSNSYPNLFAPASITFSIWGVIYALLASYTVYQFINKSNLKLFNTINKYYILSSIANMLWIFSWHYLQIGLSVVLMFVILYSLIKISEIIGQHNLSKKDSLLIRVPFSVYFGWITVATIANITTFLVSINWNGFNIGQEYWTVLVLLIGLVIGLIRMLKDKNVSYGLVLIWAYLGIWYKHISVFNGQYQNVITMALICITLFALAESILIYPKKDK